VATSFSNKYFCNAFATSEDYAAHLLLILYPIISHKSCFAMHLLLFSPNVVATSSEDYAIHVLLINDMILHSCISLHDA